MSFYLPCVSHLLQEQRSLPLHLLAPAPSGNVLFLGWRCGTCSVTPRNTLKGYLAEHCKDTLVRSKLCFHCSLSEPRSHHQHFSTGKRIHFHPASTPLPALQCAAAFQGFGQCGERYLMFNVIDSYYSRLKYRSEKLGSEKNPRQGISCLLARRHQNPMNPDVLVSG